MARKRKEVWKAVKGFEGLYEVSNYGRVKSLERIKTNQFNLPHFKQTGEKVWDKTLVKKEKFLSPTMDGCGYYHVVLGTPDGKSSLIKLHRLVAENFLPDFDPDLTVNHIDHDKSNNTVWNLNMMSRTENIKDYLENLGRTYYKCVQTR